MRIGGIQKLTLLDFPGQVACIVFTRGCDLRCPFCHNSELVLPGEGGADQDEEKLFRYLEKRRAVLDGVVVTGGEPLLQPDLEDFLRKVRALGYKTKLDTNGSFPKRLRALLDAGLLDYVAMDVKQVPEKYEAACGVPGERVVPRVEESLGILRSRGVPFELRTTLVKGIHTPEDAEGIARWAGDGQPWFLQSYVDSGGVLAPEGLSAFSREELDGILARVRAFCPSAALRG